MLCLARHPLVGSEVPNVFVGETRLAAIELFRRVSIWVLRTLVIGLGAVPTLLKKARPCIQADPLPYVNSLFLGMLRFP